jgi:lipopolysaccharide export system protein LptA
VGYADTATYKSEEQHLHLQGKEVHLIGENHRLTSRESADYWENDLKAVARNNVILQTKDKVVKTDELWVFFKKNIEDRLEIIFAYSPKRVSIATPKEIFIGDKGTYDPVTGKVVLEGNVSVTRLADQSRISGAYGTLDLNTGVSRVYAQPPTSSQTAPIAVQGRLPEK